MSNKYVMVDQVSGKQKLEGLVPTEKTSMFLCNTVLISAFLIIQGYILLARI